MFKVDARKEGILRRISRSHQNNFSFRTQKPMINHSYTDIAGHLAVYKIISLTLRSRQASITMHRSVLKTYLVNIAKKFRICHRSR